MRILLATDGSSNAEAALQVVLHRPWEEGAELRVIAVVEPMHERLNKVVGLFGLAKSAGEAHDRHVQNMKDLLLKCESVLKAKFGADKVSSDIVEGRPKESIVAESFRWGADTIVLGAHGKNASGEFLFGSVPDYVMSHARCSVEILRAATPSTVVTEIERNQPVEEDKYLLALDDTEFSAATLQEVLSRKWPPNMFFKVLSVVEPLPYQAYSGLGPWEGAGAEEIVNLVNKTMEAEQGIAKKIVEDAIAALKSKFPDATVSGEVLDGYAKDRILALAKDWPADLIIMGSHGHSGLADLVLGSVSKATTSHAPCSVLVVRRRAATKAAAGT